MADVKFIRRNGRVIPIRGGGNSGQASGHRKVSAGERFEKGATVGAKVGGTIAAAAGAIVGGAAHGVPGAIGGAIGGGLAGAVQWGILGGAGNVVLGSRTAPKRK